LSEILDVLIVGAGLSGIGMACHLKTQAPWAKVRLVEARAASGGTWDLFRYPGVRSDSDMHTLGYAFRPWEDEKAIADGPAILAYVRDTAQAHGVDKTIDFNTKVGSANWDSAAALWTVETTRGRYVARFLAVCAGYYRYDRSHVPDFAGLDTFRGRVVHPQFWPADLNFAGRKVVVVGSGATAVTIVPEMAKTADVVMLQRSPTYMVSRPSRDEMALKLRRRLPAKLAYALTRTRNVLFSMYFYRLVRRRPEEAKRRLVALAQAQLGPDVDVKDFTPLYAPWDQRLCLVPDGDFFHAVREGRARVVTDEIARFTPQGIALASGASLPADVVVLATGLALNLLGDVVLSKDGAALDLSQRHVYKGCLYEGVPNLVSVFGYANSSWTLKADLIADYLCRLVNHMRARRQVAAEPGPATGEPLLPFMSLTSGYVRRAVAFLPKQGRSDPWRVHQNYALDVKLLRFGRIDDGVLRLTRAAPARAAAE
jgi:cyclohexanone monooxygenase